MATKKRIPPIPTLPPMAEFQGGSIGELVAQLLAHYGDRQVGYCMSLTEEQHKTKQVPWSALEYPEWRIKELLKEKGGVEQCRCTVDWIEDPSGTPPYRRDVMVWY